MKLYTINKELEAALELMDEWALEHEGDITDFPLSAELEKVEADKDEKLLDLAAWVKGLRADEAAIKAEMDTLTQRRRALTDKADRIEAIIIGTLPEGQKLSDSRTVLTWRKSSVVDVPTNLTAETLRKYIPTAVKVKLEISKSELKTMAKIAGELVITDGEEQYKISIKEKNNLQIK